MTNTFLEHENLSFSKILSSKEVSDIIKAVVKESSMAVHLKCDDRKSLKIRD